MGTGGREGSQKNGRVVGIAETRDEIGNHVERHDEVGQRAEQDRADAQRCRPVEGALERRHGILGEGYVAQRFAGLSPEAFADDCFIAHGQEMCVAGPLGKGGGHAKSDATTEESMDVKGQAAIVTGGASGLGGATASALAAAGAKVAIFDLQDELGEKKAKEIGGIYVRTNVSDAANTEASVKTVVEKLGAPRVTVNCAGIGRAARTISKTGPHDLAMFAQVIQVNLIGTFNVIRLASYAMSQAEPMEDGERGVIINTASVAAFDGQIGQAAYSASKGGVVGMTLPIARDLSSLGIRVCTIAPGLFLTPMMMGLSPEAQKSLGMQVPFPPRLGDPKEYAQLAMSIVANRMLNGETIRLDGAIRMAPK
jgi:NAD(P)-dependent dehydrogenase (short-subunit alcohol dehydrogenase family)